MAGSEDSGSASESDGHQSTKPLVTVSVCTLSGQSCQVQIGTEDTVEILREQTAVMLDMVAQQLEMIADVTVPELDDRALDHGTQWTARVTYQSVKSMLDGFLSGSSAIATDSVDGGWPEATGAPIRETFGIVEDEEVDDVQLPAAPGPAIGLVPSATAQVANTLMGAPNGGLPQYNLDRLRAQPWIAVPTMNTGAAVAGTAGHARAGQSFAGPVGDTYWMPSAAAAGSAWPPGAHAAVGTDTASSSYGPLLGAQAWMALVGPPSAVDASGHGYGRLLFSNSNF